MSITELSPPNSDTTEKTDERVYPDVGAWVERWLCPIMEREIIPSVQWCPQWWDHPEAVERLEALWEAWEIGRLGGGAWKSAWWVTHADRQLSRLCHPDTGPFGSCHREHRRETKPWTSDPVPDDWPLRPTDVSIATAAAKQGGSGRV